MKTTKDAAMKTVKDAAHEYFRAGQLGLKPAADTEAAFIAGAEFAMLRIARLLQVELKGKTAGE
jgi:hypothetical protein